MASSMRKRVDIYLDESGDLGSSLGSSRYIVVAALATQESHELKRIVRSARGRLRARDRRTVELKFNKSPDRLRRLLLADVAGTSATVAWCGLEKSGLSHVSKSDRERLLHSMSGSVVSEVARRVRMRSMVVIVDKRWTKEKQRADFDRCIEMDALVHHSGHFPPSVKVSHFDSMACEGLQVVDFVVGAVFKSIERADGSYLQIISRNIVHGELL